jgi:hypothetical protein
MSGKVSVLASMICSLTFSLIKTANPRAETPNRTSGKTEKKMKYVSPAA